MIEDYIVETYGARVIMQEITLEEVPESYRDEVLRLIEDKDE